LWIFEGNMRWSTPSGIAQRVRRSFSLRGLWLLAPIVICSGQDCGSSVRRIFTQALLFAHLRAALRMTKVAGSIMSTPEKPLAPLA